MTPPFLGRETIVDAFGCDAASLQSSALLHALIDDVIRDLVLKPAQPALWHVFPPPGAGITGLVLLMESHLTVHTFPELGIATFNLYCCRPRAAWPWAVELQRRLGARTVNARVVERGAA